MPTTRTPRSRIQVIMLANARVVSRRTGGEDGHLLAMSAEYAESAGTFHIDMKQRV